MNDSRGQCFVMQPFDGGMYDRLYDEVFAPAIRDADLVPYRVDSDPGASIPIQTIEQQITDSVACFGEISEDNPNVWFELGYAIAREKPLCLVCSTSRTKFPFDVQHRKIIKYPTQRTPKDFEELKREITSRLVAVISKDQDRRQNAEAASTLSVVPETSGLAPHELLALTFVFQEHFDDGISPWSLAQEMQKGGYVKAAANLAITGLIRKSFVEQKEVTIDDLDNPPYIANNFFVTDTGQEWLIRNQHKLNLKLRSAEEPGGGLTDDDIRF
jgi:hypothetical protein